MKEIVADWNLVAKCGLYCGACKRYLKGACPGCAGNHRATWCKVRSCTTEHGFGNCADCTLKPIVSCKELNSFVAKVFGFIFRSDRRACVERIRAIGPESFAREMAELKLVSIKR